MELKLHREVFGENFTLGVLFIDDEFFGYTAEDKDRFLETGGEKLAGATAIPRGRYQVRLSMSNRFRRIMPEILKVPFFVGVRIHGGNTHADTEGCPLLGEERTAEGVRNCKDINARLIEQISAALLDNEPVHIQVT